MSEFNGCIVCVCDVVKQIHFVDKGAILACDWILNTLVNDSLKSLITKPLLRS